MRSFFMMLIVAIVVGGFSTVGHAFDAFNCTSPSAESHMGHCAEHTQHGDQKNDISNAADHICINCSHCCMSHASFLPPALQIVSPVTMTIFSAFFDINPDDNIITGLMRPPKSLI